jgi:hypothetical protein
MGSGILQVQFDQFRDIVLVFDNQHVVRHIARLRRLRHFSRNRVGANALTIHLRAKRTGWRTGPLSGNERLIHGRFG